jgi:hypothetical protein
MPLATPESDPAATEFHARWREQKRRRSEEMARRGLPDAAQLDLDRYSRKVQRALYELAVAHDWARGMAPGYRWAAAQAIPGKPR